MVMGYGYVCPYGQYLEVDPAAIGFKETCLKVNGLFS